MSLETLNNIIRKCQNTYRVLGGDKHLAALIKQSNCIKNAKEKKDKILDKLVNDNIKQSKLDRDRDRDRGELKKDELRFIKKIESEKFTDSEHEQFESILADPKMQDSLGKLRETFKGGKKYKKSHKRKSHKRNSHKRKSHKRKLHKRKSHKRKSQKT